MSEKKLEMAILHVHVLAQLSPIYLTVKCTQNRNIEESRPPIRTLQYIETAKWQVYENKTPYNLMDYCYAHQYLRIHRLAGEQ